MLEKLYKKSEIWFAVVFIIVYVVGNGNLIEASSEMGLEMGLTIPYNLLLLGILAWFIRKNELAGYYGFGKVKTDARNVLYYNPLLIISAVNVSMGISLRWDVFSTIVYIFAMIFAGIMEELLFRGLLFRAMSKDSLNGAIIVTSLTFGIGHIVNLFNGNHAELLETVCQMFYAVAIGFLFAAVLYAGKSIIPCMIAHSTMNALSAFANEAAMEPVQIPISIVLCVISGVSACVIFKRSGFFAGGSADE